MTFTIIIIKNLKQFFKNPILILFLIAMPLFQIALIMNVVSNTSSSPVAEGFVKVTELSKVVNNALTGQFTSGILVQFIMLTGVFLASNIVSEKDKNTLMRIFTAPINRSTIFSSFLLGNVAISAIIAGVIILSCRLLFQIHWGNLYLLLLTVILACFVSGAFALFISGLFKNNKLTAGVMSLVVIFMTFASGGIVPLDQLGSIPYLTINKWMNEAFLGIMNGEMSQRITMDLTVMCLMGIVFTALAYMNYRKERSYE